MQWIRTTWHFFMFDITEKEESRSFGKREVKWFTILNCDKAGHREREWETSSRGGKFLIDIWERGARKGFIQVWRWSSTTSFPSHMHCTVKTVLKFIFFRAFNLCTSLALTFSPLHPWSFSSRLLRGQ